MRAYPIDAASARLVSCAECCAVIPDDDEGANLAQHYAAMHPESAR